MLLFRFIHPEALLLLPDGAELSVSGAVNIERNLAEAVKGGKMPPLIKQLEAVILSVDFEQRFSQRAQLVQADRAAVYTAACFSVPAQAALKNEFIPVSLDLVLLEPAGGIRAFKDGCDGGLLGPAADQIPAHACPGHRRDRIDDDTFARTCFTGQDVQARAETDIRLFDDGNVFNLQFL